MLPFGVVLQRWFENRGLSGRLASQRAVLLWNEILGGPAAAHARAVGYRGTTLLIEVDHPIWAQELSLRSPQLLDRLNSSLGPNSKKITKLVFSTASAGHRTRESKKFASRNLNAGQGLGPAKAPGWLDGRPARDEIDHALTRWGRKALARRHPVPCDLCSAPIEVEQNSQGQNNGSLLCPVCRISLGPGGTLRVIVANFIREPWLSADEMARRVPGLDLPKYESAKELLLSEWKSEIESVLTKHAFTRTDQKSRQVIALRDLALRCVMLKATCRPEELTEEIVGGVLGPLATVLFGK